MVHDQFDKLAKENLLEVNIVAIANSRKDVVRRRWLNLKTCIAQNEGKGRGDEDAGIF